MTHFTLRFYVLLLCVIFAAIPLLAQPPTPPECERCETPVTPLPGPEKPEPPHLTPGSGEPVAPYVRQYWTGTCERTEDGRIVTHTAFGLEPFAVRQKLAHEQCRLRVLKGEAGE